MITESFFNRLEIRYEITSHNYKYDNKYILSEIKNRDNKWLNIKTFLDATKSFLPFFDLLGSPYKIVKSDMNGNIHKIEAVCLDLNYEDFYSLLKYEVDNNKTNELNSATTSLIWLLRALKFVETFLRSIFLKSEAIHRCEDDSLRDAALDAYNACLRPYHGWFIQKIFGVICRVIPSRSELLSLLGPNSPKEKVIDEINEFIALLSSNIAEIDYIYEILGLDTSVST